MTMRLLLVLMALAKKNLALKAKVMEESDHDDAIEWALGDIKYDYHEHLALAAKKFEGGGATRKEDSS
jgi:hypothetical protein